MIEYNEFLKRIIDRGITAASESYKDDPPKRRGALAGFEASRDKTPEELRELLKEAMEASEQALRDELPIDEYWETRCRNLEIEWVCNCVSVVLHQNGLPTIVAPTYRAAMLVAEIVGIRGTEILGLDA